MRVKKILFIPLLLLFLTGIQFSQTFTNVAQQIGITCTYNDRFYYIPGGGIGFADFDNDNDPDCIIATSLNFKVFRNDNGVFTDITTSSGINFSGDALKSVIWGDYNNDGWRDVYLTSWYSGNRLYKNNGNNTFSDVTQQAGVEMPTINYQSTTAAWGDINKDGLLDLYVGNYGNIEGQGNQWNMLFKNNGNGTFTDIASSAGVLDSTAKKPLVITMFDYNLDGWQDIYIANDKTQRSTLFKNNGDLTFTDVTYASGTQAFADAMGLSIGDINHDGLFDIYVSADVTTGLGGNLLFKNNGNGTFTNIAFSSGTKVNKECWGNNFFDYDNDGWCDIFAAASNGIDMCDVLLKNNGNSTFSNIGFPIGIRDSAKSHGSAVCDYNNDGYADLFVILSDSNARAYRNSGSSNKWLKIKCEGVQSNRDAIGSIVTVYSGSLMNRQVILAGNSFLSSDDVVLIFGIGSNSQADSVNIRWTNGLNETVFNLPANNRYIIREGSGIIGINVVSTEVPSGYNLEQNYPNPFNPSTQINFSVPMIGFVTIKVFDIMGREVNTLVSAELNPGKYSTDFNSAGLSSGIYFYSLYANGFSETKKMILTK